MLETAKKIRCENTMTTLSKSQTENAMKIPLTSQEAVLKNETAKILSFPNFFSLENTKKINRVSIQCFQMSRD